MGINVKIKKRGSKLETLVKQLRSLDKAKVQVGHFDTQGVHYSGFTYPELMARQHIGNPMIALPPRPVLDILFFRHRKFKALALTKALKGWGKRKSSDKSDTLLLNEIGMFLQAEERKIFGSNALVPNAVPPKSHNSPLIATGDLKSKVAYRNSKDKIVKEG